MARVQSASTELGLRKKVKKTAEKPEVAIYGEQVQIVNSFKCLGVLFTEEATGASEFQARLNQGYAKLVTLKPVIKRKDVRLSSRQS